MVEFTDGIFETDTPLGTNVISVRLCRSCEVRLGDDSFVVDLTVIDMSGFDVIIGIDWLMYY